MTSPTLLSKDGLFLGENSPMPKAEYFPHSITQIAIVLTMALCGGVVWHVWHVYEEFRAHQTKYSQIQELMGIITYLDEVLTMSARLGATTGDAQWEDRYRRFEPGLDASIKEIKKLAPDIYSAEAAAQTDTANIKLVEMENQAFALTRAGKRKAAFTLLTSNQYEQQKRLYAEGMRLVSKSIYTQIDAFHTEEHRKTIVAALILVSALLLLLFIWIAVLGMVRRHVMEQKNAEEQLKHLAHHDDLTGLPNRTLFRDRLGQAMAQANRMERLVALLFIDLDYFKFINDTLGHTIGDLLLKGVAKRLTDCVRQSDTVARVGGDEFIVTLTNIVNGRDVAVVAQKVLNTLSKPFTLDGQELSITASIGATIFPVEGHDVDTLLKNADTAMYRAKDLGRNNCQFYTTEINIKASG
jgi:diguanylate cyclase (GGDEF)-like protein